MAPEDQKGDIINKDIKVYEGFDNEKEIFKENMLSFII